MTKERKEAATRGFHVFLCGILALTLCLPGISLRGYALDNAAAAEESVEASLQNTTDDQLGSNSTDDQTANSENNGQENGADTSNATLNEEGNADIDGNNNAAASDENAGSTNENGNAAVTPENPTEAGEPSGNGSALPSEPDGNANEAATGQPETRAGPLKAPKNGGSDASAHFHATITTENESIANGQYVAFNVSFTLDRGVINVGDYIIVTTPDTLKNVTLSASSLLFQDKINLGNGQYKLVFNDNAINGISGSFSISAFGNNNSDSPTTATVRVGDASKTITVGAGSHSGEPGQETRGIIKWGYDGEGYIQDTAISGVYDQAQDVTITFAIEVDPRMSAMSNVVVTDVLPAEMTLDPSSITIKEEYANNVSGPALPPSEVSQIVSVSGNTLTFNFGNRLDGTKYYRIYYDVTIPAGTNVKLTNSSTITYKENGVQDTESSNFTLKPMSGYSASIGYKSADKTVVSEDPADQIVTYTITFENDQPFEIGDIFLNDELNPYVTYVDSYGSEYFDLSYDATSHTVHIENTSAIPASSRQQVYIVTDFSDVPVGTTVENTVGGNVVKVKKISGDLVVTKSVEGNGGDKNKEFSFTVTLDDTSINGVYGGMTFSNGVATFKLKDGESKTAKKLPDGTGYTVTEADYSSDGYTTTKTGETGTIDEDKTSTAAFTNTRDAFGSLEFTKTVEGIVTDEDLSGITFAVTNDDTGEPVGTWTLGQLERTGDTYRKTIDNLPIGNYSVVESNYEIKGYHVSVNYSIADGKVEVTENETAKVDITDEYTRKVGDLKVTKTVEGNDYDKDKAFEFTVTLDDKSINGTYGNMTFVDGVARFHLQDGDSITAKGLPNGIEYEVVEDSYALAGYETMATGAEGAISEGKTATASFTNTRNTFGDLTVTKTVEGNSCDKNKEFNFTVTLDDAHIDGVYGDMTFENGIATFTLKDGESMTAEGLPNGIGYEVTEDSYAADGYDTIKADEKGTIKGGDTQYASFLNIRDTFGDLTVTKTVAGNAGDKDKEFNFTVTLDDTSIDGVYGGMTFVDGIATFKLKDGQSATAENLPNGVGYEVTEESYTVDGYKTTMTGEKGTIQEDKTATAAFTNTRDAFGSLEFTKTVEGIVTDEDLSGITFTVTNDDTGALIGTWTLGQLERTGDTYRKTIDNLPIGNYSVVESNYEIKGYHASVNYGITDGKVEVTENETAKVDITDRYIHIVGDLMVTKTVEGNDCDKGKAFEFTVTLNDTSINGVYGGMTFKDGEAAIARNLPAGTTYEVVEADCVSDGYETTATGTTGTIAEGETSKASFTNTRDTFGDLTVTKTVTGNACDKDKEFEFTVTLDDHFISGVYGDMTFSNGVATFKLKDGESATAEGLPNGTRYMVRETDYTAEGYATNKIDDTGVIDDEKPSSASFTNTRNANGSLTVSKSIEGNDYDEGMSFVFTVTLDDTSINGVYGDMTFKDGVATFTLGNGDCLTAEGLPNGTRYEVVEDDYTHIGYVTTMTGETGTISETAPAAASFTNTRDTFGDLTVTKTVAGNAGDKDKAFEFTVTLDDASIDGVYGDMTFVDGIATFRLKGGQSATAEGLPNGVGYEVTEDSYAADGYEATMTGEKGTVKGGDTQTAAFTNTRDAFGSLEFTKTVKGPVTEEDRSGITFTVTNEDTGEPVGTWTLGQLERTGDTYRKTIDNLPIGNYSVVESNYEIKGYHVSVNYSIADGKVEVTENETAKVDITDEYAPIVGNLTVTKTVEGNDGDKNKEFNFAVHLDNHDINGTYGDMTFWGGVARLHLHDGQSATAEGLPNGVGYEVVEDDYTTDGYVTTMTGETGTISETAPATAAFTNTRNTFGDLTVTKTVEGNDCDKDKEFEFTVTLNDRSINGTYGDMTFENGVATFALKDGQSATAKELPNGTEYEVTEESYTRAGYVTSKSGNEGTIDDEAPATAAFTNTRDTFGELKVTKTVEGNDCDKDKAFEFTVTLDDKSINGTYGNMTFVDGVARFHLQSGDSITAEGLPNGTRYEVVEDDYTRAGYVTTKTGEKGTVKGDITQTAAFTNTRDTFGDLTVTKTVAGNAGDKDMDFAFVLTLTDKTITGTYGDMSFVNGVATFTLKHGESMTAEGLPNGVGYEVVEADYARNGYATTMTGDSGTIDDEVPATAAFTNTRDTFGNLVVTKTVTGTAGDKDKAFEFTVTLNDPSINGVYGGMTFKDGVATFTLKHGESMTAEGLPNGVGYEVTESSYWISGYATSVNKAEGRTSTGTIDSDTPSVASFENHKDASSISLLPQTGDSTGLLLMLFGAFCMVGGILLLVARRKISEQ